MAATNATSTSIAVEVSERLMELESSAGEVGCPLFAIMANDRIMLRTVPSAIPKMQATAVKAAHVFNLRIERVDTRSDLPNAASRGEVYGFLFEGITTSIGLR